jgi:hypothetical protein
MSNRCSGARGRAWSIVAVELKTRRTAMTTTGTCAPADTALVSLEVPGHLVGHIVGIVAGRRPAVVTA